MKLQAGDTLPSFWTRDIEGKVIDSKKLSGHTLLVFLRYAGCPFCNLALLRLTHEYKLLKKEGCTIVAFILSDEDKIEKHIIGRNTPTPPFSLVADKPGDFYRLFGVDPTVIGTIKYSAEHASHWFDSVLKHNFRWKKPDGNAFTVPASFLVDERGTIQVADYAANFYSDETFTKLYEYLTFHANKDPK